MSQELHVYNPNSVTHRRKVRNERIRKLATVLCIVLVLAPFYIAMGSPDAEITILMATGMHRATTRDELIERFGAEIAEKERIVIHQAQRDEDMAFFGTLPSGGELWLNRLAAQSELVIAEGFIEPHFFAGFSGGRKSILPGIASRRTVLYNHNAAFIASPNARAGRLEGNPIHRDMVFAARQAKLAFILNVLIDEDKRVIAAVAGDCERAHEAGCAMCGRLNRAEPVVSDIAVTSNGGYPLDQNLYQSVKGMTAAEACVRQGGVIIMCAALGDSLLRVSDALSAKRLGGAKSRGFVAGVRRQCAGDSASQRRRAGGYRGPCAGRGYTHGCAAGCAGQAGAQRDLLDGHARRGGGCRAARALRRGDHAPELQQRVEPVDAAAAFVACAP